MIPDLGRYAFEVLASWGVSIGLLALLVGLSFRRAARARSELERAERDRAGSGGARSGRTEGGRDAR